MKNFFFITLIILSFKSFSQRPPQDFKKINFKGKVIDLDTSQPLEYATISLKSLRNPNNIQGGITVSDGSFDFEVIPGRYFLTIEYISFEKFIKENILIDKDTDIGTIELKINVEALENINLTAERTEVEIRLDKTVYNVGKDITVRGGSVADVLDNVPSVSVDIDGNVALRGNDNVRILINGKPSGLVGLSGPQGLQQIPAESIDKVEVITSPSARYESEGTGGILNIILKKDSMEGINGNIVVNAGIPKNLGGSYTFNYKSKKINIFNTTSIKTNINKGRGGAENEYFNGTNPNTFLSENGRAERKGNNFFTNLGLEYSINNSSSLIISGFYSKRDNQNLNETVFKNFNSFKILENQSKRNQDEDEVDESNQITFNYTKKFNEKGHELVAEIQYEKSTEIEDGFFTNMTIFPNQGEPRYDKLLTDENQKRSLYQIDYVWPIDDNTQLELGYRGSFNDLSTDYQVSDLIANSYVIDANQSNFLDYKEYINAAYSQFGKKINSFSYLLGLRMENSIIRIDQKTTNQKNNKNYTDWFPTINVSYEFNQATSVTFGYSRRLRRPRSRFINPFPSRRSLTNLFQGNSDINPSYSNTLDLGYLKRLKKFTLNGSIYYTKSTSVFTFINEATGENAIISSNPLIEVPVLRTMPVNLSENIRTGTDFSITYTPNRKLRVNGNFNIFNSKLLGTYNNIDYGSENLSWFARMNASIKLPKEFDFQLRMFYRGPGRNSQSEVKGGINFSGAINKNILNKKGTISFRVSDIFNTSKFRVITTTENYISAREFRRREPTYIFTFTYKINEKKSDSKRKRGGNNFQGGGDEGGYGY